MPESTQTPHDRHPRSHHRTSSSGSNSRKRLLEPVLYFSGLILMLIFLKLRHAGMLSPSIGAFGIILLAISKQWRFKAGVIISIACIFLMVIAFVWQWLDVFFMAIFSGEIITSPWIFKSGLTDSFMVLFLVWLFQKLIDSIHAHGSHEWFRKNYSVVMLRLLFYFLLFNFLFWILAFLSLRAQPVTNLSVHESAMIAGALALLASGIPLIIYISKGSPEAKRKHQGGRHRHHRNEEPKNEEIQ
jgi:hypothetical protein